LAWVMEEEPNLITKIGFAIIKHVKSGQR